MVVVRSYEPVRFQDGGVGDMIPPRNTKNGAKASEMKWIEPVFLAAVCAPRLAAV